MDNQALAQQCGANRASATITPAWLIKSLQPRERCGQFNPISIAIASQHTFSFRGAQSDQKVRHLVDYNLIDQERLKTTTMR
jgi:hypothetical protein